MSAKDRREKAIQAYRDQQTQDNEGGVPCPTSFIAGHMAAGKEHQEEIERLKAELEKERAVTDFYAAHTNWGYPGNDYHSLMIKKDHDKVHGNNYGGKRARQRQKERKNERI